MVLVQRAGSAPEGKKIQSSTSGIRAGQKRKEPHRQERRTLTPQIPPLFVSLFFYNLSPSPVLRFQIPHSRLTLPLQLQSSPALRLVTFSLPYLPAISIITSIFEIFRRYACYDVSTMAKKAVGPSKGSRRPTDEELEASEVLEAFYRYGVSIRLLLMLQYALLTSSQGPAPTRAFGGPALTRAAQHRPCAACRDIQARSDSAPAS